MCITWLCPPRQVRAVSMWSENITPKLNAQLPDVLRVRRSRWELGVGNSLQLPELRELQEDGVGVDEREGQAGGAVEEPASQDVVPQERRRRMHQQIERVRRGGRFRASAAPPACV